MNPLIAPQLPFDMKPRAREAERDLKLQQFVGNATHLKDSQRGGIFDRDFGAGYDDLRTVARDTKQYALDHLDELLERFIANAEASGAHIHAAATGRDACAIALDIARAHHAKSCVKSKSMVTEEIGLLPAFEAAGIKTLETDLGEFILQIDGDARSHIVTPMIHKDRVATAKSFVRELGARYTEDPEELTKIAREHMRGLLRCIRCGACLNACPVYRKVGGHSYGSVYAGPIGAVLTPELERARLRERGLSPAGEESVLRVWRWLAERPALFRLAIGAAGARLAPNDNADLLFDCEVGVTDVDCAIAESGSLVVSTTGRIRNAWVTPPIHIAIVRESQILPDLVDLFETRPDALDAASTTIITGPSKTADIEGVLVTGVHGPASVEIVLVDQATP